MQPTGELRFQPDRLDAEMLDKDRIQRRHDEQRQQVRGAFCCGMYVYLVGNGMPAGTIESVLSTVFWSVPNIVAKMC
jgi:hypothetical protein